MNARMVTMEVALTYVPIPVAATSVHANAAMNFRGKMKPLEVELVVWTQQCIQSLMLDDPVKVHTFFCCSIELLISQLMHTYNNLTNYHTKEKMYKFGIYVV